MTKKYEDDLIERLITRAEIHKNISTRKSVQNNEPDRISDLLEESAEFIKNQDVQIDKLKFALQSAYPYVYQLCTNRSVITEIEHILFECKEND